MTSSSSKTCQLYGVLVWVEKYMVACSVTLGQLRSLVRDVVAKNSCTWMSGLNLIDLEGWRELKLSQTYRRFTRQRRPGNQGKPSPSSTLLSFQNLIYPLDSLWILSGLGHNYGLNAQVTRKAAVHYNGAMKPLLYLGIPSTKTTDGSILTGMTRA